MGAKHRLPADRSTGRVTFIDPALLADIHDGAATVAQKLPLLWKRLMDAALDPKTDLRKQIEIARFLQGEVAGPYVELAAQFAGQGNPFRVTFDDVMARLDFELLQRLRVFLEGVGAPRDLVERLPSPEASDPPAPRTSDPEESRSTDLGDDPLPASEPPPDA